MTTEQIRPSLPKLNLDYLVLNEPNKVEIFRKILNRKSGRELFKPFKGKIVQITGSTYISDKGKVIRRNHLAVRLKSTSLCFSGKQATPVKKGQKRPIVSSSPSSSEDNRPLKPTKNCGRTCSSAIPVSGVFVYAISCSNFLVKIKTQLSIRGSRSSSYSLSSTFYSTSRFNGFFIHFKKPSSGGFHQYQTEVTISH